LELEAVGKLGLPRLVFLIGEEAQGPSELFVDVKHGARQAAFRAWLADSGLTTATVTTPDGLETVLFQALVTLDRSGADRTAGSPELVFTTPPLWGNEVSRLELMTELVAAVTQPGISAMGMTTGLWGAGGFGKTTMARLLAHRPEIRQKLSDRVVW
jgi:hypothetical protein